MNCRYISVNEKAEELNVSPRTVQRWAKAGRLPGAKKVERVWMIPETAAKPLELYTTDSTLSRQYLMCDRIPPSLKNSPVGRCMEYILNIEDEDNRTVALCEFYYFSGQAEKAISLAEKYLDHEKPLIKYSNFP